MKSNLHQIHTILLLLVVKHVFTLIVIWYDEYIQYISTTKLFPPKEKINKQGIKLLTAQPQPAPPVRSRWPRTLTPRHHLSLSSIATGQPSATNSPALYTLFLNLQQHLLIKNKHYKYQELCSPIAGGVEFPYGKANH